MPQGTQVVHSAESPIGFGAHHGVSAALLVDLVESHMLEWSQVTGDSRYPVTFSYIYRRYEMADENREIEEQEVEDTDADTRDVEDSTSQDYSELSDRLTRMEDAINRMSGVVSAMQKAQTTLVDMGAVIRENPVDDAESDDDSFVPLEKLDFSV